MATEHVPPAEDSYLASLSDLMVGLLFIFIIILMAFALNLREAESQSDAEAKQSQDEKHSLERIVDRITDNKIVQQLMLSEIETELDGQGVRVLIDMENGVLRLPESLLFDSGEATFRPEGQRTIKELSAVLAKILPCYAIAPLDEMPVHCGTSDKTARLEAIFIEGHTDDQPIHNEQFEDNWSLSVARALNTYRALVNFAPTLDRLQNPQRQALISVSAYEARRPVVNTQRDKKHNRRIDLRFLMASPSLSLVNHAQQRIELSSQ
ncbi:OmpA family protein [Candidatus Albibeggiatoa sp. nov. BB20]|uniref:OmpA/MotB family protein n=1 Tax=Candidatus Albibeggiatoa sp. nov. BB20 TaxID=3162723 RepID=UPI003365333B